MKAPRKYAWYWAIVLLHGMANVSPSRWDGDDTDKERLEAGNVFHTAEEAGRVARIVRSVIRRGRR